MSCPEGFFAGRGAVSLGENVSECDILVSLARWARGRWIDFDIASPGVLRRAAWFRCAAALSWATKAAQVVRHPRGKPRAGQKKPRRSGVLSCVWVAKPAPLVDRADSGARLWRCPPGRQRR